MLRTIRRFVTAPSVDEHPSGRVAPWTHALYALVVLGLAGAAGVAFYAMNETTRTGAALALAMNYIVILWLIGTVVGDWTYASTAARSKREQSIRLAKHAAQLAEHEAWRASLDTRTCLEGVLARQAEVTS